MNTMEQGKAEVTKIQVTPPPPQQGVLDVAKPPRTFFLARSSRTEPQILVTL